MEQLTLRTTVPVYRGVSKRGFTMGIATAEFGVFLDATTTPLIVQRFGLRLEANPFSRLILVGGAYLMANIFFMLFLLLLSYVLYRYASPQTATVSAWGFLLLGLFRGFFGVNNLLILSGLHPLV
jgi:hypothetical protein